MEDARTRAIGINTRGFDSFRFASIRFASRGRRAHHSAAGAVYPRRRDGKGRWKRVQGARAIDREKEGRATDERVVCRAKRRENVEHGAEQVQRARGGED